MAKRYSGNLAISVVYDDRGHYRTAVSRGGKLLWRGTVNPAPAGFGPGIAYDSSKAYDEVASSALSFADHEVSGIGDDAEYDENLTGYLIRRASRGKSSRSHSTRAQSFTVQHRNMSRVYSAPSLTAAISAGKANAKTYGPFDVSGKSGEILWTWEQAPHHSTKKSSSHATVAKAPPGFTNISTTYQLAYQTYDGNVQVRKIGDRLWEVLPRGRASFYEKSRAAALERAFQLDAARTSGKSR